MNNNNYSVSDIMWAQENLERDGLNHPLFESAMVYTFGIDWEKDAFIKGLAPILQETMHFDTEYNTWMDN